MRLVTYVSFLCFLTFPFFFNATAPTEIYTLSLHDALPISSTSPTSWRAWSTSASSRCYPSTCRRTSGCAICTQAGWWTRSEEHTSELQSRFDLVCRLLLEKKKRVNTVPTAVPPIRTYDIEP